MLKEESVSMNSKVETAVQRELKVKIGIHLFESRHDQEDLIAHEVESAVKAVVTNELTMIKKE